MYILVTLFLAVGAINAQNNLLFWLFGFAIAILVTSGILSGNAMMRLHARALPTPDARAGEEFSIRYQLKSRSRLFPLFGLVIREEETRLEMSGPAVVVHLSPGSSTKATARLIANTRGRHTLPAFRIESTFPFGIIRKWIRYEQPRTLLVVPHALPLREMPSLFHAGSRQEDQQAKLKQGGGSEFFGLRPYAPGDPRRKIAWKTSARRDGLVVIQHAQETEPRLMIWMKRPDRGSSTEMIERSIALACSLAREGVRKNCAVGMWAPWAQISIRPASGQPQLKKIERTLAHLNLAMEPRPDTPPSGRSGRLIRVICGSELVTDPENGVFAVNQPAAWLRQDTHLPSPLIEQEGGAG